MPPYSFPQIRGLPHIIWYRRNVCNPCRFSLAPYSDRYKNTTTTGILQQHRSNKYDLELWQLTTLTFIVASSRSRVSPHHYRRSSLRDGCNTSPIPGSPLSYGGRSPQVCDRLCSNAAPSHVRRLPAEETTNSCTILLSFSLSFYLFLYVGFWLSACHHWVSLRKQSQEYNVQYVLVYSVHPSVQVY